MAIIITDECINCGACEPECPNNAIYEPASQWSLSTGTTLKGTYTLKSGRTVDADDLLDAISDDYYFVVPDKCTECVGFHEEPQCASVCPVDCCIVDENDPEAKDILEARKVTLHGA